MKNLVIDALSVNIDPNKDYSVQLDINMEDAEYESILSQYGTIAQMIFDKKNKLL